MDRISLFHVGPQKSGTTWIYRCLAEHPEIEAPVSGSIHYFDMFYHRSREWLYSHFTDCAPGKRLVDPTQSYLRSPLAAGRIREESPHARIAVCMRHPVERAFSHYWHEKKKKRHNFRFGECLENYDLFASWVEPGFYARHIERYLEWFPRDQILAQRFDELEMDPAGFLAELYSFYGVAPDFNPSVLGQRINVARPAENLRYRAVRKGAKRCGRAVLRGAGLEATVPGIRRTIARVPSCGLKTTERISSQPDALIEDLMAVCLPEIERLENLLSIDLAEWRKSPIVR